MSTIVKVCLLCWGICLQSVTRCVNVILGECYQKTKAVLHSALPSDALVGRVTESKVISDFLTEHLSKMVPGSMYVSGAPGTGKTAVLMKTIEQLQVHSY